MIALDEVGLFVATSDDEVVGYASCGMTDPVGVGDLDIYVHPDHWGEGIGEQLLARGRDHLADLETGTIRDEVLAANDVGNAFYEKHFERVDQRTVAFDGIERTVNVYETRV
jgi:ribosomal protein S18 acetylase RimI-like enzyme